MTYQFSHRPRRLRENSSIRALLEENTLTPADFVLPVFISDEPAPVEIKSMPGVFRWPIPFLNTQFKIWTEMGIRAFALFPRIDPSKKDTDGSEILNKDSLIYRAASHVKNLHPNALLIADLALDPYTTHGQDGVLLSDGIVDNDGTIQILANASIICANAGFDWVAPSDMMDGRVGVIRSILEQKQFHDVGIISYSAKFASAYYGPFRSAINSASPQKPVDKRSYQLNPANIREAKRELWLDYEEGADMLMIKPAEPYLDVISYASQNMSIPIAAYQVSGEYSRIMAANQLGWLDWRLCALESLMSIKRSGASLIFSYFADQIATELRR